MPVIHSSGGGSDNMYADAEGGSSAAQDSSESTGETAQIPKSLCPGMKPGDKVVLTIVKGTEDDWIVAYKPDEEKEEQAEEPAPEPASAPDQSGDDNYA